MPPYDEDDLESISDKDGEIGLQAPSATAIITPGSSVTPDESAWQSSTGPVAVPYEANTDAPGDSGRTCPATVLPTPPASDLEPDFEMLEEEPALDIPEDIADPTTVDQSEEAYLEPHGLAPLVTPVNNHFMYIFFRFCAERHRMFNLRNEGVPRDQLTEDETMKKEHIGNIYRELDSGSLRMDDLIIPAGDQSNEEVCFRIFLFSGFYLQSTWQTLVDGLGEVPNWKNFDRDFHKYESILFHKSVVRKEVIYTSAFQLVPPTIYFGRNLPHFAATLRFVKTLMLCGLPERLRQCQYAVDASHLLRTLPTLGGFLSLCMLTSLQGSPHLRFYYRNFATCGPGSRAFLQRMFGRTAINSVPMEQAGLKWLYDNQWTYWARIGETPPHARSLGLCPGMRVLDFENALCWAHRYVNAYERKGYRSFADLPVPEFDPGMSASMPAWCYEEKYVDTANKVAFVDDYDEEMMIRRQEESRLEEEGEDEYEVEKIVCRKGNRTDKDGLFRVRWKGYPPEHDTWQRASSLDCAKDALQEWLDWEEAVWDTIDKITREMPYSRPFDAPDIKDEKPFVRDVKPVVVTTRSGRTSKRASRASPTDRPAKRLTVDHIVKVEPTS